MPRLSPLLLLLMINLPVLATDKDLPSANSALWNSLSSQPGSRPDIQTLQSLFANQAWVMGGRYRDQQAV